MATLTAGAGSTTWTSAAFSGGAASTNADDIVVPTGATLTISSANTVVANSVSVTGTGTLVFAATTSVINLGSANPGASNVALSVATGATITLTGVGTINFISTSATQQTIDSGGKNMPVTVINGAGSSYLLSAAYTSSSTFTLTAGTFDTGNFNVQCTTTNISGSTARTLTPGSSTWTTTQATGNPIFNNGTTTNLTMTANTATFVFSGQTTGGVFLGGFNYNGASFSFTSAAQTTCSITGGGTINNLTWTGPATKTSAPTITGNLTLTGAWSWTGNSAVNRSLLSSGTLGTQITISAATNTNTSNVDVEDIAFTGAATWTGTSLGDCGGNSGMTFTTPATQTHDGTTSNWSTAARWTSRVPLPQDNVILNTGSGTVTADMPRLGKDITTTGFTGTLAINSLSNTMYGSLTLSSGITLTSNQTFTVEGRGTHTFTSAGKSFGGTVTFQSFGGSYTLQDAFTETAGTTTHSSGTLDTNGFTVTTQAFTSTGAITRVLSLGVSTISLTSTSTVTIWNVGGPSVTTLNATASTIVIANASANTRTVTGSTFNYGTLTYTVAGSTGILALTGQLFDTINFSDVTNARTLQLTAGTVVAVKNFNVQGTSGKLMTVKSATGGSPAYLDLTGGYDTVDYLSIQDITSVIPYKFYAGANSTNVSGNLNITFAAAPSSGQYIDFVAEGAGSGSSATVNFPYGLSPTSGQIIHLSRSFSSAPGTVNGITGYTATGIGSVYYKVSDGTETSITSTVTGSPSTHNLKVAIIGGFTGTPTFDVGDTNSGAGVTSLNSTASTGPTNTDAVAIIIANYQGSGSLGASVSATNNYLWQRYATETSTYRMLFNRVTSSAANSTTYTWTTSRNPSSTLVVYKDVSTSTTQLSLMTMGIGT